jgi:hypothetical protein
MIDVVIDSMKREDGVITLFGRYRKTDEVNNGKY